MTETSAPGCHHALNSTGYTRPQRLNAEKSGSGDNFEQGSSVQNYTLEKVFF